MKITFTENPYPYKHWLTSIVVGPLFFTIYGYFSVAERQLSGSLEGIVVYSMIGLVFSLPVFILYLIIFNLLFKMGTSPFVLKAILNMLAVLGVIITFKIIFSNPGMLTALFYSFAIIVSSFFYHINKLQKTSKDIEPVGG